MINRIGHICLLLCLFIQGKSENPQLHFRHSIDSVYQLIQQDKSDTGSIIHWTNLSVFYRKIGNFDSALIVVKKSIHLAHECIRKNESFEVRLTALKKLATAYFNLGTIHNTQSNYDEAIEYYNRSLMLSEQTHQEKGIVNSLLNLGVVYKAVGNYPLALDYYLKGLKKAEALGNEERIASFYLNLGSLYKSQNNHIKAKEYFDHSLKIALNMRDLQIQGSCYGNLATLASHDKRYEESIQYYRSAMRCFEQTGDIKKYAGAIGASAMAYAELANSNPEAHDTLYEKAEEMLHQSIELQRKINTKSGIALELLHLGQLKLRRVEETKNAEKIKLLNEAEMYLTEALDLSLKTHAIASIHNVSHSLFGVYSEMKNAKKALQYYKMYMQTGDSLFSMDKARELTQYEMNYEFDQKKSKIKAEEEKQDLLNESRNQQQKMLIALLGISFILISIIALFIFRSLKTTKSQSDIIHQQKLLVEEKQKEILDSIHYAKKIQQSLLTTEFYIHNSFKRLR